MNIEVLQKNLSKGLNISSRFVSTRSQLPILGNILLKASGNKLLLCATNLEVSSTITLGAKVENEGEIAVPAKTITDIVSNLSTDTVSLFSEKEILRIKGQNFVSRISGVNSSDFPHIPISIGQKAIKIPAQTLANSLSKVVFAASSDETRPLLTGDLLIVKKHNVVLVATDGFRLSQVKIKTDSATDGTQKVILPKAVLVEVMKSAPDEGNIAFSFRKKDSQAVFALPGMIFSSRIMEGEFPNYERIIPKDAKLKVVIDKEDLLRAVKLCSVIARDSANVIKLVIKEKEVNLLSESKKSGKQDVKIEANTQGDSTLIKKNGFCIAFNYRFLENFLTAVGGAEIEMQFSATNSPGVFIDPNETNFLHLIMPVKIEE